MNEQITINMTNFTEEERELLMSLVKKSHSKFKIPKNLQPGDVFKDIDGEEWIFLFYETETGDMCILKKEPTMKMQFGNDNNYHGSDIDNYLINTYLKELERKFGADNIVEHEVDLLSLDGETSYGIITRKVSIPTLDIYRHNKKAIKPYIDKWFWLATPNSTPSGYSSDYVQYVDSDGNVDCDFGDDCGAVRPMLFLSSNIYNN